MRGTPKEEIMKEVYLRLANYLYREELPEEDLIDFEESEEPKPHFSTLYGMTDEEYTKYWVSKWSRSSEKQKEIEKWIKEDPKGKKLTPTKTRQNGWVTLDHIERDPCPYGSPNSHRYEYLNDPHIQTANFEYFVKKPRQKNRQKYTEKVYRLNPGAKTRMAMHKLFENGSKCQEGQFSLSPYARSTTTSFQEMLWLQFAKKTFSMLCLKYQHHIFEKNELLRQEREFADLYLFEQIKDARYFLDIVEHNFKELIKEDPKKRRFRQLIHPLMETTNKKEVPEAERAAETSLS